MKSKVLIKLMVLCLVVFGLIIFSNKLVRGMNKADLVEKMTGKVSISRVASNSLETESGWMSLPSYNFLWPLWSSTLSPKDFQISLEIPLVNSFYGFMPLPPSYLLDKIAAATVQLPFSCGTGMDRSCGGGFTSGTGSSYG